MAIDFEALNERIRQRAHAIWEREGRPEGREDAHWGLASEEIAVEDNYAATLKPNPSHGPDDVAEHTEPVEPALAMANQGEQPGLADQGEDFHVPGASEEPWPEPAEATAPSTPPARGGRRGRRGA
ncbi:DUF2934 domain-containing protein [Azospirillum doebereinerae]|uniref:DUF2934 domain-containing protein n=1 Tax=Azospirillum doebereinerae TaxID=92933 RepID=A0A433JBV4_9PROT|nr:DUF2934 domain-containing protein [Azospirillum doebereinerae]MCG5242589.1 DUF2934 domain-containing protein [Azospirillum doebereinerae]RUQ74082.1 DUF2934 domain-containing protein [Azospirillum doebereinerae]